MIVVKFGGHAMKDENGGFAKAIAAAQQSGVKIVVVHRSMRPSRKKRSLQNLSVAFG
jgi:acetylglutamate kinase